MKKLMIITILLAFIGFYINDFTPVLFAICLIGLEQIFKNKKYSEAE